MTAKRKAQPTNDTETFDLKTVLQDDGDSEHDSYADIDSLAALRLIHAVSSLGGMVTFWHDSNNQRLCFSMRLWGQQRSFQVDSAAMFPNVSEPIVSKLSKVMQDKKLSPPPPLRSPTKADKS